MNYYTNKIFTRIELVIAMIFCVQAVMCKKSIIGAPIQLNYAAMIISVFFRYIERIPAIKDLAKYLNQDIIFKLNCGFLISDKRPPEASYSILLPKLRDSHNLE